MTINRQRKIKARLLTTIVLLLVGGAITLFVSWYEPPFDYGKHSRDIIRLETQLNKEPCDRSKILKLLKRLNKAGDYRRTIAEADRFFQQCGQMPRLLWNTHYANMKLGEFQHAINDATKLIESDPDDTDFWWWRGKAYRAIGDWEKAASDFDTCMNPKSLKCPWDLSEALEKLNRPCEAISPLAYLKLHFPQRDHNKTNRRMNRLREAGNCVQPTNEAAAETIRFKPGATALYAEGRINLRPKPRFLIDTGASYVAIPLSDAKQYGLDPSQGRKTRIRTATGIFEATVVLADYVGIGSLVARNVEVVMMEAYKSGPNKSGLIGLSFLRNFEMTMNDSEGTLTLRSKDSSRPAR